MTSIQYDMSTYSDISYHESILIMTGMTAQMYIDAVYVHMCMHAILIYICASLYKHMMIKGFGRPISSIYNPGQMELHPCLGLLSNTCDYTGNHIICMLG